MIVKHYKSYGPAVKCAIAADLHGNYDKKMISAIESEKPDVILIPGDLCSIPEDLNNCVEVENAMRFLVSAVKIAPVFYSTGNHEWRINDEYRKLVASTGAILLENAWTNFKNIHIGGLSSVSRFGMTELDTIYDLPDPSWLKDAPDGYKILLCHHPEYYPVIEAYDMDLILAGHCHGGQIRFFNHGLYAPGQGWFPKYTRGRYGKMIVSTGLAATTFVPRLFNPTELIIVDIS